jgi:hypothetical protein
VAAAILDTNPTTFRRHLERNVVRLDDGSVEARVDGIVARKFGGRWRVLLGDRWLPRHDGAADPQLRGTSSCAVPEHTGRPEGEPA